MIIVGCDYHPGFQPIAFVDSETGELPERRREHPEAAEKLHYQDAYAYAIGSVLSYQLGHYQSGRFP